MTETTKDGSGWVWIRKHTRFVKVVFDGLGSCGRGQAGIHTGYDTPWPFASMLLEVFFRSKTMLSRTERAFADAHRGPVRMDEYEPGLYRARIPGHKFGLRFS